MIADRETSWRSMKAANLYTYHSAPQSRFVVVRIYIRASYLIVPFGFAYHSIVSHIYMGILLSLRRGRCAERSEFVRKVMGIFKLVTGTAP